jgi:ABC-2 type transport system ATP-binding protein
MISVSNLSKSFGDFCAVNDISFSVQAGEVLGFLGPNGAGKSTTMKMLTGFLAPTSGSIDVMGISLAQDPVSVQQQIGYLPEGAPSYADMTVEASLRFVAKVRGFRGAELDQRVESVVRRVALEKVLNKRIETLSKGFRRRLGLAQAILHDPKVLVLDEPTDGLDPNQKHQVRELIRNLSQDKIVIVSTHILEEVSAVCSRAMILADGKILFDGTPDALAATSDYHNSVLVKLVGSNESLLQDLSALGCVERVEVLDDGHLKVLSKEKNSILSEVNQVLHRLGCQVEELHVEQGKLDDVFRILTSVVEVG